MSNLVIKSDGIYGGVTDKFLNSLKISFTILAGIKEDEVAPSMTGKSGKQWERWRDFFCTHDCSAVWIAWYGDYGVKFLSRIEAYASLLESFGTFAFKQAIDTIDQANKSGDRAYILDMIAYAIEGLYDEAEVLSQKQWSFLADSSPKHSIESSQMKVELAPSDETGSFDISQGGCQYDTGRIFERKKEYISRDTVQLVDVDTVSMSVEYYDGRGLIRKNPLAM